MHSQRYNLAAMVVSLSLLSTLLAACDADEIAGHKASTDANTSTVAQADTTAPIEQSEPSETESPLPVIYIDDAFKEMDVIASFFDCEITQGARPNSLVCLLSDDGFYAAVIYNGFGVLEEVIMASVSRDGWKTELPNLELLLERYYAMDVQGLRNIYSGLYDANPNMRAGTEMALQSMFNTHAMFSKSKMSIPPDTQQPFIAFSFEFK